MLEIMICDKRNGGSSRIAGGEGGCVTEFTDSWMRRKVRAGERSKVRFGEGWRWARSSSPGRGPYKCHASWRGTGWRQWLPGHLSPRQLEPGCSAPAPQLRAVVGCQDCSAEPRGP